MWLLAPWRATSETCSAGAFAPRRRQPGAPAAAASDAVVAAHDRRDFGTQVGCSPDSSRQPDWAATRSTRRRRAVARSWHSDPVGAGGAVAYAGDCGLADHTQADVIGAALDQVLVEGAAGGRRDENGPRPGGQTEHDPGHADAGEQRRDRNASSGARRQGAQRRSRARRAIGPL